MPSCPGLILMLQSTISLTAGSVEHSLLHQWKASHDGHLHFKEKTFSKFANNFDKSYVIPLLHLMTSNNPKMVAQSPATAAAISNYYVGPLDQKL